MARRLSHDPCRTVFSVVSQTIAAAPPLLSVKVAYRSPKTGLEWGVSQKKLAPEDVMDASLPIPEPPNPRKIQSHSKP